MKFIASLCVFTGLLSGAAMTQDFDAGIATLEAEADAPGFSGAIVLMRDGEIVFEAYRGVANQDTGRAIDAETRFNVASAGKFITAMAYVQAARAGGMDPAALQAMDVFADDPGLFAEGVSVPALLAHAAQVDSFISDDPAVINAMDAARSNNDVFQLTRAAQSGPITRNPQGLAYSNAGFILVGEAIARISGQSYETYLTAEIFEPLGLSPLFTRQAEAEAGNLALPYLPAGYDPEAGPRRRMPGEALPERYPDLAESPLGNMVSSAAGGLYISARDFAALGNAALAGEIIDAEDLAWMCTSVVPVPERIFGLGCGGRDLGEGRRRWGHNGGAPGVNAEFALYPDTGLVLVILSNHNMRASPVLTAFEGAYFGDAGGGGFVVRGE